MLSSSILLLSFLYFIQGLPYGFQSRFMPIYLRSRGMSLTNVGLFKLLLAPWMCKALWAPLVDRQATKRHWLLWSIGGLAVTCSVASIISPYNLYLLCFVLLSLNLFAATQDIAVDGIAVAILKPEQLGKGNTAQVVGYKLGAIFGGGILVWFLDNLGWMGLFFTLTAVYLQALFFAYISPSLKRIGAHDKESRSESESTEHNCEISHENKSVNGDEDSRIEPVNREKEGEMSESIKKANIECHEHKEKNANVKPSTDDDKSESLTKKRKDKKGSSSGHFQCDCHKLLNKTDQDKEFDNYLEKINSRLPTKLGFLKEILEVPGTVWMMGYVLIYKLGEQGALNMLPLFLVDQGIHSQDVTFWTGVVGQAVSIGGSLVGGWLLTHFSLPTVLMLQQLSLCRLMALGATLWVVAVWQLQVVPQSTTLLYYGAIFAMNLLLLVSGTVTTLTFTFMMQCSQKASEDIQATHYTTLATLEVFGKLMFGSLTGWLVDIFGYGPMYLGFVGLAVAVLPWLQKCPRILSTSTRPKDS